MSGGQISIFQFMTLALTNDLDTQTRPRYGWTWETKFLCQIIQKL